VYGRSWKNSFVWEFIQVLAACNVHFGARFASVFIWLCELCGWESAIVLIVFFGELRAPLAAKSI